MFLDDRDSQTPGWKFAEWEMRGVPLRMEIGPKDLEKSAVMVARRDTRTKESMPMDGLAPAIVAKLDEIQAALLRARARSARSTRRASARYDEFKAAMEGRPGFVIAGWCGGADCEAQIKADTQATLRNIPFGGRRHDGDLCEMREAVSRGGVVRQSVLRNVVDTGAANGARHARRRRWRRSCINGLDTPSSSTIATPSCSTRSLADPWNLRALVLRNIARPVVNISYAADAWFWGLSALGFHVTSSVLHIIVVGLFYGFCTRALSDARLRRSAASAKRARAAAEEAEWPAFFAAGDPRGPSRDEQRRQLRLRAIGTAVRGRIPRLADVCAARDRQEQCNGGMAGRGRRGPRPRVEFVRGSVPVAILAYDAWVLRDPGWQLRAKRYYAPAMLIVGVAIALQLPNVIAVPNVPPRGVFTHLLAEAVVAWRYVALLFVPLGQAVVHDVRWPGSIVDPVGLAALAAIVAAVVLAVRVRKEYPLVALGAIWFAGVLAPTFIAPVRDAMVEHRLYLAAPGLLLAMASAAAPALSSRRSVRAAMSVVVIVLSVMTFERNRDWREPMVLWQQAVERSPGAWQAHLGYAELLRDVRRCERAAVAYREVLRLYPGNEAAMAGIESCR